jgi:hypothetical protein
MTDRHRSRGVTAPALLAAAILATAAPAIAEDAAHWRERACPFSVPETGAVGPASSTGMRFDIHAADVKTVERAVAQAMHDFGFVLSLIIPTPEGAVLHARRFQPRSSDVAVNWSTDRVTSPYFQMETETRAHASDGTVGFDLRFVLHDRLLTDPCPYNAMVARLFDYLPADARISRIEPLDGS